MLVCGMWGLDGKLWTFYLVRILGSDILFGTRGQQVFDAAVLFILSQNLVTLEYSVKLTQQLRLTSFDLEN